MIVKLVSAKEILSLRHKILRPNQEIESAMYPNDNDTNTFHCAIELNNQIVSTATFVKESYPDFKGLGFRLRGMATAIDKQKTGLGNVVLNFGIKECEKRGADYIWCNARQNAFLFYEKLGFKYHGELFDIPGINLHKVMYKYL